MPIAFGFLNDVVGIWTSCFMLTADSCQAVPVAPARRDQDFTAAGPSEKWGLISPTSGRGRAGCIWRW
jgi:hypothetical protein